MSHIRAIALKSFPYSEDGVTELAAVAGKAFDCPERHFDGLNAAGFIRREKIGDGHFSLKPDADDKAPAKDADTAELKPAVDPSTVEIPADWRDQKFFALRSLAKNFTDLALNDITSANVGPIVEAELARRAAKPPAVPDEAAPAAEAAKTAEPAAAPAPVAATPAAASTEL